MWPRARLLFHTLIYLKPWQVMGRVWAAIKRKAGPPRLPDAPAELEITWNKRVPFHGHDPWNSREDIMKGRFCFLNEATDLDLDTDWRASQMPLLWQFNLHYFHFLYLLEREEQEAICQSWIRANPPGTAVAWHPYPTALRIVNWCRAELDTPEILGSLYQQAAFLYRNLETYIYGNHLLENARALVMAGCYFAGQGEADKWLEKGVNLYLKESREQILPDGGHYERSPMYHALMLEGYLDVLNVLPENHGAAQKLEPIVEKMMTFFASILYPDGSLPLFNDSTHEIASTPEEVLHYAHSLTDKEPRMLNAFEDTGYFVLRDERLFFAIDGGPAGPRYLMAHAHADVFTFVLSIEGVPFIVDSGVYEYQAGTMRDYVRSTKAHNTVVVDDMDQVECWGSFRVARRSAPEAIAFKEENETTSFMGQFRGYSKLIGDGINHQRKVLLNKNSRLLTIEDRVEGRSEHLVESHLHLHPDVSIEPLDEGGYVLRSDNVTCRLYTSSGAFEVRESFYSPRFGTRIKRKNLVLSHKGFLPAKLEYAFGY